MVPPEVNVADAGLKVTLGPEGEIVPVTVRVPLNSLRLVIVIVVVAEEP